jgi:hypothetical protein
MIKIVLAVVVLFSSIAIAADCFDSRQVRSWKPVDNRNLVVRTRKDAFNVQTSICTELKWADAIAFNSFFNGKVCRGDELILMNAFHEVQGFCRIRDITKQ